MWAFLKKMLGGTPASSQAPVRFLTHPEHLQAGDILKFGFLEQAGLSAKQFEVAQINTYIYGDLCYPEIVLRGHGRDLFYLMVEEEDGEEYLGVCIKIPKSDMETLFPHTSLDDIIALKRGTSVAVQCPPSLQDAEAWFASSYVKVEGPVQGSFLKGDARLLSEEMIQKREWFSSYLLEDKTGEFALEIEVYTTGEIEVAAILYLEIGSIAEMWPHATHTA